MCENENNILLENNEEYGIDFNENFFYNSFVHILENYRSFQENDTTSGEFYSFYTKGFRKFIENKCNNFIGFSKDFKVTESTQTHMSKIPWYGISFNNENFLVYYLFDYELDGFYISIGLKNNDNINDDNLEDYVNKLKFLLKNNFDDGLFYEDDVELNPPSDDAERQKKANFFKKATLFSKFYEKSNLPSEDIFINDLKYFLKIYQFLYENNFYWRVINSLDDLDNISMQDDFNFMQDGFNFHDYLISRKYYFNKFTIESFLLSLKVKPFIIFTGNSGTGKTKLVQLYAEYLMEYKQYYFNKIKDTYENMFRLKWEDDFDEKKDNIKLDYRNYQLIPVGANWTDNRNILGYFNILEEQYVDTPAYLLINVANEVYCSFFLILDEMNLSHVERYFSDFLSSMESSVPIPLYGNNNEIKIPSNLFVIGTVNIDETTYMFSPKVLDRANVIEFDVPSVNQYMDEVTSDKLNGNMTFLEDPLKKIDSKFISKMDIGDLKKILSQICLNNEGGDNLNLYTKLKSELSIIQDALKDSGFEFGFRVINEILRFIVASYYYEKLDLNNINQENSNFQWQHYFDIQIKQKILPKLHGSEKAIGETLNKLLLSCLKEGLENFSDEFNEEEYKYPISAEKLFKMINNLNNKRYVSFID